MDVTADIINELGLWRWLVVFLVISLMPVVNSLIREWIRAKKERSVYEILYEIRNIIKNQYTDNISLPMCEALLQPLLDNASRFLIIEGREIIKNNHLDQKEIIESNVRKIVDNAWSQNGMWLSHFYYRGKRLSEVINIKWKEEIIQLMLCSIYNAGLFNNERGMKNFESNISTEFDNIRFNALSILQQL